MIARLIELEDVDSTNNEAMRQAENGAPHGTVVRADSQKAGKGRRGRSWQSPGGVNLYFSLLLRPSFEPEHASMLTLLMAMAAVRAIVEDTGADGVGIKWPNDILLNRKKICGILTELKTCQGTVREPGVVNSQAAIDYVVIGVGINVNLTEIPEELAGHVTSLRCELHRELSRGQLLEHILQDFEAIYLVFEKSYNLEFIRQEYNQYLAGRGEEVRVLDPQGEYVGISHGITERGELLIQKPNDSPEADMVKVYAGEVSIRGKDGYA